MLNHTERLAYSWNERPVDRSAGRNLPKHMADLAKAVTAFCKLENGWSSEDEASDRGLLPPQLREPLGVVGFLMSTVLDAQQAQRDYGVPASVLISIGLSASGWCALSLPGGNSWFGKEARRLARSQRFRPALAQAANVRAYVTELDRLGYFGDKLGYGAEDILAPIDEYALMNCDVPGLLPSGEYSGTRWKATLDIAGKIQLCR